MDENSILKRAEQVTFQTVAGEAILIRMDTGTYFSLNPTGTDFWELLDGRSPIAHHAVALANKYNHKADTLAAALLEMAQRDSDENEQQALADEYDMDVDVVKGHLAEITAGTQAAAIAEEYYITADMVISDLLELAQEMQAEKLINVV
jgi:hypothetical protein